MWGSAMHAHTSRYARRRFGIITLDRGEEVDETVDFLFELLTRGHAVLLGTHGGFCVGAVFTQAMAAFAEVV